MKLKNNLKAMSLAIPGLIALPAGGGTWHDNGGSDCSCAGYSWDWNTSGYTSATYSRTGWSTHIYHYSKGKEVNNGPWDTIGPGTTALVSLYVESYTWNAGCYSDGISYVQDNSDANQWAESVITYF